MRPLLAPAERLEGLQALTAGLSAAATRDEVTDVLVAHARFLVDAEGVAAVVLTDDRTELLAIATAGLPEDLERHWRRIPMDTPSPIRDAVAVGRPVFLESPEEHRRRYPGLEPAQGHTVAAVPIGLRPRREPHGALVFRFADQRVLDEADRGLIRTIGELYGQALDRATLFEAAEAERTRLETLMRQLPVGVAIAEAPSGDIVAVNEKALDIWRLPPTRFERITDVSGYRAFRADGSPIDESEWPIARSLASGEVVDSEELEVEFGDGTRGQVSISSRPIEDALGRRLGAVTTLVDVTEAHRREARARFVAGATEVLARSLDPDETLHRLARLAVPEIADWCTVHVRTGNSLRLVALAHRDGRQVARALEFDRLYPAHLEDEGGVAAVLRSGRPQLTEAITREMIEAAGHGRDFVELLYDDLGLRSALIVPLSARGAVFGALTLIDAESGRRFDADDVAFATELAVHAALAVDNARLYVEQSAIADTLQTSLLPYRLPTLPDVEIATRYRAARLEGNFAGGDFFDVWEIDPERFGFAIGDVSGKGAAAAALTALIRHTVRTASICLPSHAPADVLWMLNDAVVKRTPPGRFCTAVYGLGERTVNGLRITLGSAGHPRPYLICADGSPVQQPGLNGPLLGVVPSIEPTEYVVMLSPGDRLVLFTDGVTERRHRGRLFGDTRLRPLLESRRGGTADSLVEAIETAVAEFAPGQPQDDVALLVLGPRAAGRLRTRGQLEPARRQDRRTEPDTTEPAAAPAT